MPLGKRQRETLDKYADLLKRNPATVRVEVFIERHRAYTREFGSGRAIVLKVWECYDEGEYRMQGAWIANCAYDYTAVEKGQEIARYLLAAGCLKDRIKVSKQH